MFSSSSEALVIHKKHCNKGKLTKHQTLALGSVNDKQILWQDLFAKCNNVKNYQCSEQSAAQDIAPTWSKCRHRNGFNFVSTIHLD